MPAGNLQRTAFTDEPTARPTTTPFGERVAVIVAKLYDRVSINGGPVQPMVAVGMADIPGATPEPTPTAKPCDATPAAVNAGAGRGIGPPNGKVAGAIYGAVVVTTGETGSAVLAIF